MEAFAEIHSETIAHAEIEAALTQARKQFAEIAARSTDAAVTTTEVKVLAEWVFNRLVKNIPGEAEAQKKKAVMPERGSELGHTDNSAPHARPGTGRLGSGRRPRCSGTLGRGRGSRA